MRVTAFVLAPAYRSISANSASPRTAAQCSAVMPSARAAFTSAPCLSNARTASLFPFMDASATAESDGAAATIAAIHKAPMMRVAFSSLMLSPSCAFCIGRGRGKRKRAGAVAKRLHIVESEHVQQGQLDVRHGCSLGRFEMEVAGKVTIGVTEQHERTSAVAVDVAVSHRRTPNDHRL